MEACLVAGWVVVLCIFMIMMLLIHHKLHHSNPTDPENYIPDPLKQWFQYEMYPAGDVCNFTTCSHEMWILFLVVLGLGAVVILIAEGC